MKFNYNDMNWDLNRKNISRREKYNWNRLRGMRKTVGGLIFETERVKLPKFKNARFKYSYKGLNHRK